MVMFLLARVPLSRANVSTKPLSYPRYLFFKLCLRRRLEYVYIIIMNVEPDEIESLSYADFTDSNRLRAALLQLVHPQSTKRKKLSIKLESFLTLTTSLLNVSLIGRLIFPLAQLKGFLRRILVFYNSSLEISDCIDFILSCLEFEYDSNVASVINISISDLFSNNIYIALECISMILLNVKTLSFELKNTIQSVRDKIAYFNILHKDKVETLLRRFFSWIRENTDSLRKSCLSVSVLESIDSSQRAWIKGEIYEHPRQIVSIYQRKYKQYLQNIQLSCLPYRLHDMTQALKDIARERITYNGQSLVAAERDLEAEINNLVWNAIHGRACKASDEIRPLQAGMEFEETEVREASQKEKESAMLNTTNYSEYSNAGFQILVDFVYSHVCTAACRSIISGDVYLIVNDLYGSPGLALVPEHIYNDKQVIKIEPAADSIIIVLREVFTLLRQGDAQKATLCSFSTRTVTRIDLKRLLSIYFISLDAAGEDGENSNLEEDFELEAMHTQYLLEDILSEEEVVCSRIVSITPFLPLQIK